MFVLLLVLGALVGWWCYGRGYILYFGDAESHLNIARRIFDSRTPGYEQIGTSWLPLPHVLMLPFISNDWLWRTGLAGTIPGVICFALGGMAMFAAVRRLMGHAAAVCAVLLFALNPNLLYMQSTPMTEPVLLASLLGLAYFTVVLAQTGRIWAVIAAGICSTAASLTRYEGWFLIPFVCLFVLYAGGLRRWPAAVLFGLIASAAPVYWLAHNYWYYGNALEFYNGPYSAQAIYLRGLAAGEPRHPSDHNLSMALLYYRTTAELCMGLPLYWLGVAGVACALWKRAWWPVVLLGLPPLFYVISLYSSGTPIHVPSLWPHSYYNTRYGMVVLPLLAFCAAALVSIVPQRFGGVAAAVVVLAASAPWIFYPRPDSWICWKESQVNSVARREWTALAATFFREHRKPGEGILFSFGDATGILREAGIPLKDGLHEGNGPHALAVIARPDLFLWEQWAVSRAAEPVAQAMYKPGVPYRLIHTIGVKGAPPIEIYKRIHDYPVYEGARRPE